MGIDPVGVDENNVHSHNRYAYGNNNPYKFVDPDGRYADLAIEVVSIGAGVYSFNSNLAQGNYGDAAIDGIGVVVDGALAIVPGVPGGVGLGIKAARGSDNAVDAAKAIKNKPELIHTDPRNLIPTEKPSSSQVKKLAKDIGVDEVRFKTAQVYDYENDPNNLIPTNEKYSRYKRNADGSIKAKINLQIAVGNCGMQM